MYTRVASGTLIHKDNPDIPSALLVKVTDTALHFPLS
jgi:hypothetical protein